MVSALWLVGVLLAGAVGSMIGVPFLAWGIYRVIGGRAARNRVETVEARITRSAVERYRDVEEMGDGSIGDNRYLYEPAIEFEYEYGGRAYRSDLTAWERRPGGGKDRGRAESVVSRYAPGETVTAFVDPENPSRGFLERDEGGGLLVNLFLIGFGGTFAVVGFVAGVVLGLGLLG